SAVESIDDRVLERLDKHHTRADFIEVVRAFRDTGLTLNPTFVTFTPWITPAGYRELLDALAELDLVEQTAPIQLAIRLLIPAGSKLLELDEVRERVGPFDPEAMVHPWAHPDPAIDALQREVLALVQRPAGSGADRVALFER